MIVEEIAAKHGFKSAQETLEEQEQNIRLARARYLTLLKNGLKEWRVLDDEEKKRLESVYRAIDKYMAHLEDKLK